MDKRVEFVPRLMAALVDGVVILIAGGVAGGTLGAMLGIGAGAATGIATQGEGAMAPAAAAAVGFAGGMMIGFALVAVLYSLIEAFTGASPGKMIMKLKIGTEDGRTAPLSTYLTRWAVKYSSQILGALAIITGISVLSQIGSLAGLVIFVGCFLVLGAKRQAIHDMVARTAVFKKADLA